MFVSTGVDRKTRHSLFLGERMEIMKNQAISRLAAENSPKVLQKLEL